MADPSFADIAMRSLGMLGSLGQQNLDQQQSIKNIQNTGLRNQFLQQKLSEESALTQAMQAVGTPKTDPTLGSEQIDTSSDAGAIGQMRQQITGLQKQAAMFDAMAQAPGIGADRAMEFTNQAANLKKSIASQIGEVTNLQTSLYKKMGDIAGGVKTQDDLDSAYAQMMRTDPETARNLPLDRDPVTKRPLLTQKTAQNLQNFSNGAMSRSEQLARAQAVVNEQDRERDRQDRLEQRKREEEDRNARSAQAQATVKTNQAIREDALITRIHSEADNVSRSYRSDDQVKEYAEHKKLYSSALNYVLDDEGKPKKEGPPGTKEWGNFDSASDFELSKQFLAMTHPHYRGATYDAKELMQFANLPEKLARMIARVATGGPTLPMSDRINMLNAMKRVLSTETPDQIQREDKALQRIANLSKNVDIKVDLDPTDYVTLYAPRPKKDGGVAAPAATTEKAPAAASPEKTPKRPAGVPENAVIKVIDGKKYWSW